MNKQELRKLYLQKRAELSPNEIELRSNLITQHVSNSFHLSNQNVSLFLTIQTKHELNTQAILSHLLSNNCQVAVSKSDFSNASMDLYIFEDEKQLELSPYGIPEPKYGKKIEPSQIDIVFVPLLCFDKRGYRVGYGKGFYDRFLAQCKKNCITIGLSLFDESVEITTVDSTDIPLNFCVTPNGVIKF